MTVLPSRTHPGAPRPGNETGGRAARPRVAIRGSFTTPDLATGSMRGWLRVLNFSVQGSRLRCLGVVSGALYDADGVRLGLASTRCVLPVSSEAPGDAADPTTPGSSGGLVVEALDVGLLGFQVHVQQARLPAVQPATDAHAASRRLAPTSGR